MLTVNHKELAITADCDPDEVEQDPLGAAFQVAERSQLVVLVGGARKHVVAPDGRCWVSREAAPAWASPGPGTPRPASSAACSPGAPSPPRRPSGAATCTPAAGERLAASVGVVGYLARELPGQVPAVLGELS